jgi:hypothetical protein
MPKRVKRTRPSKMQLWAADLRLEAARIEEKIRVLRKTADLLDPPHR